MSWMGNFAGNLAVSGAMYGAMAGMSYDSATTDPLNQTLKYGGGFAIDQAVDIGIMGIGGGISSIMGAGGENSLGSRMTRGGMNFAKDRGASAWESAKWMGGAKSIKGGIGRGIGGGMMNAGRGLGALAGGGTSLAGKALRHAGGVGLAAHMALGFMGMDPSTLAMSAWESAENKYRSNIRKSPMQMSHASSRHIQDQLHTLRNSGNEAEFMHN